jgi:hypothetical protein
MTEPLSNRLMRSPLMGLPDSFDQAQSSGLCSTKGTNGWALIIVDIFPFMLRHSKHSESFFSSLLD